MPLINITSQFHKRHSTFTPPHQRCGDGLVAGRNDTNFLLHLQFQNGDLLRTAATSSSTTSTNSFLSNSAAILRTAVPSEPSLSLFYTATAVLMGDQPSFSWSTAAAPYVARLPFFLSRHLDADETLRPRAVEVDCRSSRRDTIGHFRSSSYRPEICFSDRWQFFTGRHYTGGLDSGHHRTVILPKNTAGESRYPPAAQRHVTLTLTTHWEADILDDGGRVALTC